MQGVDEIELTLGYMPQIETFEDRYLAEMSVDQQVRSR